MSNFFVFTFLISIVCLIVFLIKPKFRTKKLILDSILAIAISFILVGITVFPEEIDEMNRKASEEQVLIEKAKADKKAKKEQISREQKESNTATEMYSESTVYMAPNSGTKFYYSSTCRGMQRANSIVSTPLSEAIEQEYELCGYED